MSGPLLCNSESGIGTRGDSRCGLFAPESPSLAHLSSHALQVMGELNVIEDGRIAEIANVRIHVNWIVAML